MEDSTTEKTRASINKKIDNFTEEGLEHAAEMLSALWEVANKDGDVKAPVNTSSAVSLFRFYLLHLSCGGTHFTSPDHADHESRTLVLREARAHQVGTQGGLFRQEVLG